MEQSPASSRPELMVVDDESELRAVLLEYFARHGFEVRAAANAAQARGLVAQSVPDAAILDINLPGENGLSLARWLREAHPGMGLLMLTTASLPPVLADADQCGQVVLNLLVNAQQGLAAHTGERHVRVLTGVDRPDGATASAVWLRVADSGPGVADDVRARLFEPFFTTKPDGLGTGLGLSMSRSIAREHGGELALEPAQPQGGASFLLTLPLAQPAAPSNQ